MIVLAALEQSFYFVRHGETLANANGHYSARSVDTFSAKGQEEVQALTDQLLKMTRFDLILVSPAPRTLRTIAPYLEKTHQRAYIWPLLYECCTGKRPAGVKATRFGYGSAVVVPTDLRPYFLAIPGETRYPTAPDYAQGLAQVHAAAEEFKRLYKGKSVLLVGHSGQGGHFIHELTGKWTMLRNADLRRVAVP
jgi:broad specificity phosphatase PhoE